MTYQEEYGEITEHLNFLKKSQKEYTKKLKGINEEIERELMVLKLINQKNDYSSPLYERKYELSSLLQIVYRDMLKYEYRLKNLQYHKGIAK